MLSVIFFRRSSSSPVWRLMMEMGSVSMASDVIFWHSRKKHVLIIRLNFLFATMLTMA